MAKARIAAALSVPGRELTVASRRQDRRADRGPAFGVGVEQDCRPVRRRFRARDQMRDRQGVVENGGLVLRRECRRRGGVVAPVDSNAEPALADPRENVDVDRERETADLLEPESVLFDQIEGEPVAAGWARSVDLELELDLLARADGMR